MIPGIVAARRGGAPALWTPAQLTTAVWFDASDSGTITLASGDASAWNDKSGNGRNASQATSTKRPTLNAASLNSLDTLNFDADDHLATASVTLHAGNWSTFAVARRASAVGLAAVCGQDNSAGERNAWYLYTNGATAVTNAFNTSVNSFNANAPALTVTDWNILGGTVATGGGSLIGYANGVAGTPTTVTGNVNAEALALTVGARHAGTPDQPWTGDIAEIVLCASVLSQANREKMEGYLAHKWGLTALLDSGHPYKSAAPTV